MIINFAFDKMICGLCVAAVLFVAPLAGCSVGMALHGHKDPDFALVQKGCDRTVVESQLGAPRTMVSNADGSYSCTYEYQVGNEASAGRAAVHAGMDVLTLGIWEVFGTPVEALQGSKYRAVAKYGADDKLQSLSITPQ
jgi:hypothetical protein